MNLVKIFNIFFSLFNHMFVWEILSMFFPMFDPCIRCIQAIFLTVLINMFNLYSRPNTTVRVALTDLFQTIRRLWDPYSNLTTQWKTHIRNAGCRFPMPKQLGCPAAQRIHHLFWIEDCSSKLKITVVKYVIHIDPMGSIGALSLNKNHVFLAILIVTRDVSECSTGGTLLLDYGVTGSHWKVALWCRGFSTINVTIYARTVLGESIYEEHFTIVPYVISISVSSVSAYSPASLIIGCVSLYAHVTVWPNFIMDHHSTLQREYQPDLRENWAPTAPHGVEKPLLVVHRHPEVIWTLDSKSNTLQSRDPLGT